MLLFLLHEPVREAHGGPTSPGFSIQAYNQRRLQILDCTGLTEISRNQRTAFRVLNIKTLFGRHKNEWQHFIYVHMLLVCVLQASNTEIDLY